MRKISKLLVMAIVVLAVITMSIYVNAGISDLTNYVLDIHNINGMVFELTNSQKSAIKDYILTSVTDAQADVAYAKIKEAENLVASTGVTKMEDLSKDVKSKVIYLAVEAANSVGLTLNVNTKDNTFKLYNGNKVLASGKAESLVVYQQKPAQSGSVATGGTQQQSSTGTKTTKLLYTGSNYAVYACVAIAVVASAVVVAKKRA